MYIDLSLLLNVVLSLLGIATLILLIIFLIKFIRLISNINLLIDNNKNSISKTCRDLPVISKNTIEITDNVKGITDVATEATAEAIVAKDNLLSNYETIKDIINIVASIFIK
ncbi:MAG: hypothetical protein MJ191_06230 [Clostridium sp.]|nr:hypothetical protein [Clostridium sp.]